MLAAALLLWTSRHRQRILEWQYQAPFPIALVREVEDLARSAASNHGVHLHVRRPWNDDLEDVSLWLLPNEDDKHLPIMAFGPDGAILWVSVFGHSDAENFDPLVREVKSGLEKLVDAPLCRVDLVRWTCARPSEPLLLYLMGLDNPAEKPGQWIYDLAERHGVRAVQTSSRRLKRRAGGVEGLFEAHLYPNGIAHDEGRFSLRLTNVPSGDVVRLSVLDRGGMRPDDLDRLIQDAKATVEGVYGRTFCRADPAAAACDAEHAEREREREAWLRARAAGAPAAIEAFLAAHADGPQAEAARERLALLRRLAAPPPPAPRAPANRWIGGRAGETFADWLDDGSRGPQMTVVPGGVFRMGCASGVGCGLEELPVHEVRVAQPFALSAREVTHAEYFRFARPEKRLDPSWATRAATHLTWAEAAAYAAWLSDRTGEPYRLPSEAEWERAARAGGGTAYHWGDGVGVLKARCAGCDRARPHRTYPEHVGSHPPNAWGLFDMHGNAAEWTADCWHPNHLGAPPDGAARADGDCSRRVVRGGSYDTPPRAIRSAARVGRQADERYLDVGFRVLRELRNVDAWRGG